MPVTLERPTKVADGENAHHATDKRLMDEYVEQLRRKKLDRMKKELDEEMEIVLYRLNMRTAEI
jgi:hypothetical protein